MINEHNITVDSIKGAQVFGNHFEDQALWELLDKIIMGEHLYDIDIRYEASKKIDEIVGEDLNEGAWDHFTKEERVKAHFDILNETNKEE